MKLVSLCMLILFTSSITEGKHERGLVSSRAPSEI